jgi:hypothetical protein
MAIRLVPRGVVAVVALLGLGALLLEGVRWHLERSDELRLRLETLAQEQLGAVLVPGEIEVGFFPARIELLAPAVELGGSTRLELGRTRIDLSRQALLEPASARIGGLSLEGPARLRCPHLELAGELRLALRPAPTDVSPGAWSLEGEARLASGGSLALTGGVAASAFELYVELDQVETAPFAELFASSSESPTSVAGRHSGTFELGGGAATGVLRVASEEAEIRVASIALFGPVSLVAEIPLWAASPSSSSSSSPSPVAGRFTLDASGGRVEYAGGLGRGAGSGAILRGRIVRTREDRLQLEELALEVERFDGGLLGRGVGK